MLPDLSNEQLLAFTGSDIKNEDGSWNNDEHDNGIVNSPYFTINIGGKQIQTYGVRTTMGMHTLAYIALKTGEKAECYVSYKDRGTITSCKVLPSSLGTKINKEPTRINFSMDNHSSYTIILNGDYQKAITIFVYDEMVALSTRKQTVLEPGDHGSIGFGEEGSSYRFKKGFHYVDYIAFKSNCDIVLDDGAVIIANKPKNYETPILNPDWAGLPHYRAFFDAANCENISIKGHGFIDFTSLPWHARVGLYFSNCKNITLDGFTMNGAGEWTLELMGCSYATIENVAIFGYRQNSDAFAIVDSDHVNVSSCFARSGDDLFEVKTMDPNLSNKVSSIEFSSCVAWPDKCRAYGIIHETKRDISGVLYRDVSVIKSPADWMDALGCLNVIVANDSSISDIRFENVEINECSFYPINVSLTSSSEFGSIKDITFANVSIPNDQPIRLLNATNNGTVSNLTFSNISRNGKKVSSLSEMNFKKEGTIGDITII